MTSKKQIIANRTNALKGGVKTLEGKMRSRMNAKKHGILSNLMTKEENDFIKKMKDVFAQEYKPSCTYEHTLIEMLAVYHLKLERIRLAETERILAIANPREYKKTFITPQEVVDEIENGEITDEGYQPFIKVEDVEQLDQIYLRYEVNVLNQIMKIHKELGLVRNRDEFTP
jgi:hypothetical protein